jgi:sugar phosphate isomerase/epimerase
MRRERIFIVTSPAFRFPLCLQTVLPADYPHNEDFIDDLRQLQHYGFHGIELNIADIDTVDMKALTHFLDQFDLKMTMLATGLAAKTWNLSLSSSDPQIRTRSIDTCRRFIAFCKGYDTGVIIGFLKGAAAEDQSAARANFADSLGQIAPFAHACQVPLLIEATNRYESSVANTLAETYALIADVDSPNVHILPDTFHMNIEEADMAAALSAHADDFVSIHISDNNRFFPGLGAIDFAKCFDLFDEIGFTGTIAIEGMLRGGFRDDLKTSMDYLDGILRPSN